MSNCEHQWRDIESAPKDGTRILAFPCMGRVEEVKWFQNSEKAFWHHMSFAVHPTHWMPLPSPPEKE